MLHIYLTHIDQTHEFIFSGLRQQNHTLPTETKANLRQTAAAGSLPSSWKGIVIAMQGLCVCVWEGGGGRKTGGGGGGRKTEAKTTRETETENYKVLCTKADHTKETDELHEVWNSQRWKH